MANKAAIVATTGERLAEALKMRHMNASDLSRLVGISKSTISYYLKDKFTPKQDKIYQLSEALRVSPSWLMGLDVDMNGKEKYVPPYIMEEPPALFSASTIPSEAYNKIIADMKDILSNQEAKTRQIAVVIDEVESTLHAVAKNSVLNAPLLEKYNQLSSVNKSIIDSTIDAMLKTQSSEKEITNENEQDAV